MNIDNYQYEEQEIDLKELLFLLLNNLRTICITSFLFLILGVVIALNKSNLYESSVVLMVNDNNYTMQKIDQSELSLNQKLVSTYTEIAKNKDISSKIIKKYEINLTPEQMRSKIKVMPIEETEFIKITYRDPIPKMTAVIVNEIASEFIVKVEDIMGTSNLAVIEKASTPRAPINNKKKLIAAVSLLLGAFLGVFIIFIKEFFQGCLKKSEDISRILNMKILGYIPDFYSITEEGNNFFNLRIFNNNNNNNNRKLFFLDDINTPMTESFRKLKNNIKLDNSKTCNIIAFTSSISSEGKTTISTNYALNQAISGKKVLLIDCDMKKSKVGRIFGVNNKKKGLYSYLNEDFPINDIIIKNVHKNLDLIVAEKHQEYFPEMLYQKNLSNTFNSLRDNYDLIIVDTSPIGITSDLGIISEHIDALVMICGYNMITKQRLNFIKEYLMNLEVDISGVVINKIEKNAYSSIGYYTNYYDEY